MNVANDKTVIPVGTRWNLRSDAGETIEKEKMTFLIDVVRNTVAKKLDEEYTCL